jgi:MFS family permease
MLRILANRDFARLFAAQLVALLGTGLMTVALGLLAYQLAGGDAGAVLGTAYAIKMLAYVGLSPLAHAVVARLPRKAVMIGADLVRGGAALCLPFVSEVWQVYVLIFVLQAASATFTPTFQAVIPDILPDEGEYTRALSLSRLAYDIENLASPALAGLLLLLMPFSALFAGTALGFAGSALLVRLAHVPAVREAAEQAPFLARATSGVRHYLATPRLRGLLALNLAAAAAGAFVLVNTVVLVRDGFGRGDSDLAVAMAAFGAGSMAAALLVPRVVEILGDRRLMMVAGHALCLLSLAIGGWLAWRGLPGWPVFLLLWAGIGALYSAILTPSGRLIRRSGSAAERPALFTAQFALSHACWLVSYPLAGFAGRWLGMAQALLILGALALAGVVVARRVWPG